MMMWSWSCLPSAQAAQVLRSNPFSCSPTWSSSCKSWKGFFYQIIGQTTKLSNLVKLLQILRESFVKLEEVFKQILKRPLLHFITEVFKNIPPSANSEIFLSNSSKPSDIIFTILKLYFNKFWNCFYKSLFFSYFEGLAVWNILKL